MVHNNSYTESGAVGSKCILKRKKTIINISRTPLSDSIRLLTELTRLIYYLRFLVRQPLPSKIRLL